MIVCLPCGPRRRIIVRETSEWLGRGVLYVGVPLWLVTRLAIL